MVTGFGASDKFMEFVVHVLCRNVTEGATVTDECQEIVVDGARGNDEFSPEGRCVVGCIVSDSPE